MHSNKYFTLSYEMNTCSFKIIWRRELDALSSTMPKYENGRFVERNVLSEFI